MTWGVLKKIGLVIMSALALVWVTSAFDNAIGSIVWMKQLKDNSPWLNFLLAAICAVLVMLMLVWLIARIASPRVSFRPELIDPDGKGRSVLLIGLSSFTNFNFDHDAACEAMEVLANLGIDVAGRAKSEIGDGPKNEMQHSWVQNFRAIRPHRNTLKRIYVIASTTHPASAPDAWRFAYIIRRMFEVSHLEVPEVYLCDNRSNVLKTPMQDTPPGDGSSLRTTGVDYNDFNALRDAFASAIVHARSRSGHRLGDICIDITAGTKQLSAAGTASALNSEALLSYINNDGKAALYRTHIDPGLFADAMG